MAEEFGGGVCGGKWPWNSSRNLFASSPCSLATHDMPSFGWPNHHDLIIDMKAARSSDDSAGSASDGGGGGSSVVIQDVQKPQQTFQMMGISLSSSTAPDEWNQDLLHDSGRSEENYSNFLLDSSMNYQHDWSSTNSIQDSSITSFKQVDQSFPLDQIPLNSISTSTDQCPATCSALSASFPLNPASYGYTSSLLQTLFDTDSQSQQSLLDNQSILNYSSSADQNYQVNLNGFFASLPKASPMVNPSFSNQQTNDRLSNVSSTFLPSIQSQFLPSSLNDKKLPNNLPSLGSKHQHDQEGKESASVAKKGSNEAAFKRQRIETPSPLPTFKVRKEKLGDRITALQQLVSPFGKTDTASVLHEAIDYIKFLHDQVNTLSTPYLKYGSPPLQRHQVADKHKDEERQIRDLKSRGLCLVPISSTFPVASETSSDFWTPTFGGNFK